MRRYLAIVGILLAGYAFLGKGFAYIGIGNIFVGEVCLVYGLVTLLMVSGIGVVPLSMSVTVLILFMAWGAIRTLPYLPIYGIDAIRDAVTWGYAVFSFIICSVMLRTGSFFDAMDKYIRLAPLLVIWVIFALPIFHFFAGYLPTLRGTETPILTLKAGDLGVHVGAIAALVMLGLHKGVDEPRNMKAGSETLKIIALSVALVIIGAINRGGLLAAFICISICAIFLPFRKASWWFFTSTIFVFILILVIDVQAISGEQRAISIAQVILNIQSIFGISERQALDATASWRLLWWSSIIDYTIFGDYFWLGKGFGVNLADSDGIIWAIFGDSLRSPHNGHLTILARAGVPGLALWVAFNAAYVWSLGRAYVAARRRGHDLLARINLWLVAYWAAFVVNMSFDVYLEGPQGGIWFWSVIGAGIAFAEHQRRMFAAPEFRPEPASSVPAAGQ